MCAWQRQRLQPRLFRIPKTESLAGKTPVGSIYDALKEILDLLREPREAAIDRELVAGVATAIWRLGNRQKVLQGALTEDQGRFVKRLGKALQMAEDVLRDNDVEVRDYTDKPHDPGNPPAVAGRQASSEDLSVLTVVETVVPTVFYRGVLIQSGEIVLGMPAQREGPK